MPDDGPWADPVVVPDDLRELQADVDAYHRERRLAERRRRVERVTRSRVWHRFALPVGVLLGSLGLASVVLIMLTSGQPQNRPRPKSITVNTDPGATTGTVGGLVPDVELRTGAGAGQSMRIRDLRPALVALVPNQCDCTDLLRGLATQADEHYLPLVVIAPTATDADTAALPGQTTSGQIIAAYDETGSLAATYDAAGVTLLTLYGDGTVGSVETGVASAPVPGLDLLLTQMTAPVQSFSTG